MTISIYKKLSKSRAKLAQLPLQKSGKNKFADYSYFELSDFIPQVLKIFDEEGLCGVIQFQTDVATLSIYDCDAPQTEPVVFISPMVKAAVKGSSEIQNLGGTQTYLRRYLWMMAMELTDGDIVDLTSNSKDNEDAKQGGGFKADREQNGGGFEKRGLAGSAQDGRPQNQTSGASTGNQPSSNSTHAPVQKPVLSTIAQGPFKGKTVAQLNTQELTQLIKDLNESLAKNPALQNNLNFQKLLSEAKEQTKVVK